MVGLSLLLPRCLSSLRSQGALALVAQFNNLDNLVHSWQVTDMFNICSVRLWFKVWGHRFNSEKKSFSQLALLLGFIWADLRSVNRCAVWTNLLVSWGTSLLTFAQVPALNHGKISNYYSCMSNQQKMVTPLRNYSEKRRDTKQKTFSLATLCRGPVFLKAGPRQYVYGQWVLVYSAKAVTKL